MDQHGEFLDPWIQRSNPVEHPAWFISWMGNLHIGYRPMIQVYIYNTHDSFFSRLGGMILILGWRLETHNSNFSIVWCRLEKYLQGSNLVPARPDKGTSFDCYSAWAPIHWHFSRPTPYYMFLSYLTLLWLMLVSDKYVTSWVLTKVAAYGVKRLLSEQIGSRIYRGLLWAPTLQPLEKTYLH